jgi:hypothetical protein
MKMCLYGIGDIKDFPLVQEKYDDKPTYDSLRESLAQMRTHALAHGVKHIAMPKIGCGLDQLQWPAVKTLLKNIFQLDSIALTVYIMEGGQAARRSRTDTNSTVAPLSDSRNKSNEVGFGYRVRRPLPDAFEGLRIVLAPNVDKYEILRRHIVGYGGSCLESSESAAPTHVIHETGRHKAQCLHRNT